MSAEIDAVLVEQLARLGGGQLTASGVRWTAKRLRTETAADQVRIDPACTQDALRRAGAVLDEQPEVQGESGRCVRGLVSSGFGGLNPAYVVVEVDPSGVVSVAAYAQEGLIKQRTAAKAVRLVLDAATGTAT